jgi:hypothetical protein
MLGELDTYRPEVRMKTAVFETSLLPDGHLDCPEEFAHVGARFKVFVSFGEADHRADDADLELAAVQDTGEDFLVEDEVAYYLSLEDA